MQKVEVRAAIKYFCKKGMTLKEIHEDFMKILGNECPSYRLHGFITFTQSQKCKSCNGSSLDHPLPRSLREFLRQGR